MGECVWYSMTQLRYIEGCRQSHTCIVLPYYILENVKLAWYLLILLYAELYNDLVFQFN